MNGLLSLFNFYLSDILLLNVLITCRQPGLVPAEFINVLFLLERSVGDTLCRFSTLVMRHYRHLRSGVWEDFTPAFSVTFA